MNEPMFERPLALAVAFALVSLLPFVFMTTTAFVKISTVLHIVKSAIGAPSVPSGAVVVALSAALTLLVMAPVGEAIVRRAAPLVESPKEDPVALVRGAVDAVREPLREFLGKNTNEKERGRFLTIARNARAGASRDAVTGDDLTVLVPAFVVTELTEAFAVGFLLLLPFLVIDLVVANVLTSLGMQSLSATQTSLPFKLLLFVAIDGWGLLAQALVASYR